jgi:hypothetical protein
MVFLLKNARENIPGNKGFWGNPLQSIEVVPFMGKQL